VIAVFGFLRICFFLVIHARELLEPSVFLRHDFLSTKTIVFIGYILLYFFFFYYPPVVFELVIFSLSPAAPGFLPLSFPSSETPEVVGVVF